jgi:hypothetical protein
VPDSSDVSTVPWRSMETAAIRAGTLAVRCGPCHSRGRRTLLAQLTTQPSQHSAENGARDLRDRFVPQRNWPQWEKQLIEFCQTTGWWLRPLRRGETVYGIVNSPVTDSRKLLVGQVLPAMKSGRKRLQPVGEFAYPLMTGRQVLPLACPTCPNKPRLTTRALLALIDEARRLNQDSVYI